MRGYMQKNYFNLLLNFPVLASVNRYHQDVI